MRVSAGFFLMTAAVIGLAQSLALSAERPAAPVPGADIPVKVVVLYSSGVGYFEHFGRVQGDSSAELRFKAAQINDILKSLVLQDLDRGTITAVTYPSQDPLEKTLASFQVDITGNPSLAELLNQLRGAKVVAVAAADEQISGTIIGVEAQQRSSGEGGEPVTVHVVNVLSGATIRSVELGQLRRLELEDRLLQEELEKALATLAQARGRDTKPVEIHFAGQGERRVRMGYVVETPVWKTSYRLILPSVPDQKPILQGWAIVENQSDTDWRDVQLALVSGRPISFVQNLYQPLYIPRPVVEPELYAGLRPQAYDAGLDGALKERSFALAAAPVPAAPLALAEGAMGMPRSALVKADVEGFRADGGGVFNAAESVTTGASAAQLGELFQYTVATPVTLARQQSAMLPILNDQVEAEAVSIYNAMVLPRNPLNGAILSNTTGKHLLQGPITVLAAGAYAGDARINDVPPGQERLLSYGIDLQVLVDGTTTKQESSVETGRIVRGVMHIARKSLFSQEYRVENRGNTEKLLVIEHPFRAGWHLVTPEQPLETTDQFYRFRLPVAAGSRGQLPVEEEITQWERVAILPMDHQALLSYTRIGSIPQAVRDAITEAAQLKQVLVDAQRRLEESRQKAQDIAQAQQRTRDNMQAIDSRARQGDYYSRLLQRLAEQDAEMDNLQEQADDLQQKLNAAQQELEAFLAGLSVG